MSHPFDATLKDLGAVSPGGLLALFDAPTALPVTVLNPDLSTVTTAADLVLGLGDPLQEISHFDFQVSASARKHRDVLVYNSLLHRQYDVPVHSTVTLLRPEAAHRNLNGRIHYAPRPKRGKMEFKYETVRLWEVPVATLLAAEVGVLPLAPLGQLPPGVELSAGLAAVVKQMEERLHREASPDQVGRLLTAAFVLTGLRGPEEFAKQLFKGVNGMHESSTYMAILEEGRQKGLQEARQAALDLLLELGEEFLGPADEATRAALASITDVATFHRLARRAHKATSWEDLLKEQ